MDKEDLTMKFLAILGDIDNLLDRKQQITDYKMLKKIDEQIDDKELEMFRIKGQLEAVGKYNNVLLFLRKCYDVDWLTLTNDNGKNNKKIDKEFKEILKLKRKLNRT